MVGLTIKMERKLPFFSYRIYLWVAVLMHIAMIVMADDVTDNEQAEEVIEDTLRGEQAWSWGDWGRWSPCSKTCGGGVTVQTRECELRSPLNENSTNSEVFKLSLNAHSLSKTNRCLGPAQRYRECNTAPCLGSITAADSRAQQCAAYDRRPFRGRYYHWVPYIDGDSPCTLNCRPLGKHFYATLALVADGTPCTKPGSRAICVQGVCKVVGRSEVAGAGAGEARCGRRLVSGLFSRPRLPLGYSLVATVPRGACRLNVSEILPTDNYIALKLSNSSYIMNGEFAVSTPGSYDAAGARFQYSRAGDLDSVYAHGPILHPVDIMILYTQPNPSIKYEYYTESMPGELDIESRISTDPEAPSTNAPKHVRRHHAFRSRPRILPEGIPRYPESVGVSKEETDEYGEDNLVGSRMFMWKILAYTQCSRSCGGGIQIGKFRCVESNANGLDREVSPVHCSGSPPVSRRKRCGAGPCPPRWRAAAWTACPQCGPATRTRIVGCVQDHSKGITKINDHKCPAPKPETIQNCDLPNCNKTDVEDKSESIEEIDTNRFNGPRIQTDNFRDGPVYTVSVNNSDDVIGPEYTYSSAGGWLFTEWSECVGWCVGGGVQTRGVRCADPAGCAPRQTPETSRTCSLLSKCEPYDGYWYTGEWSSCSSTCRGKRVRGVLCIGGSGRHLRDSACKGPRPDHQQDCGSECAPTWYMSDWSQCTGACGEGIQRRTIWCARGGGGLPSEECPTPKPMDQKVCQLQKCPAANDSRGATEVSIDTQRIARNEVTNTQEITTESEETDCIDKLNNCGLAVQARLCHYKYYTQNCCFSCRGR